MAEMATTSNPNAKVLCSATGTTTPSPSPNLSARYKLSVGTVVNAYGQTVLNPGIGSALAPLASKTPTPAAKAPAPTPPATPRTTQRLQHRPPAVLPVVLPMALLVAHHRRYLDT